MSISKSKLAIPRATAVLVTGVSGFVGSSVADQILEAGFRVRAVVRNTEKAGWLREVFEAKYGPGKFELVEVPEPLREEALDDVIQDEFGSKKAESGDFFL